MVVNVGLLVAQIAGLALAFGLVLFLAAGAIAWLSGWIFLALFFSFVVVLTVWLYQNNPGLLKERMRGPSSDQKTWDKRLLALTGILFFAWLLLMPLDAVRFGWSKVPVALQVVGALILLGSFYVFFITFRENAFLSPLARIQTDRGQTVVSTGPYSVVRHPMYAGFVLFALGTPLLLGSWYGLGLGLLLVGMVARRAVLEEHMLRTELPGYEAYLRRVTYRLVPRVW